MIKCVEINKEKIKVADIIPGYTKELKWIDKCQEGLTVWNCEVKHFSLQGLVISREKRDKYISNERRIPTV